MNLGYLNIEYEEQKGDLPSTYLIENTVNKQFVRLGMKETYYLLTKFNAQDKKECLKIDDQVEELPMDLKEILNKKFDEWGFYNQNIKNIKKSALETIKKIYILKFNVQKVLNIIYPMYSKFFTKTFLIFFLLLFTGTVGFLTYISVQFSQVQQEMTIPLNSFGLTAADIILIVIFFIFNTFFHEFAHAVTCVKYGGKVNSMGLMLFYFIPCFYCDVSSVYQFKNKKQRAIVALSGVMVNMFIGCVVMLIAFICAANGIFKVSLFYMAVSALFMSIYNLIPFVKLDGYWVLQALTGIDNLMDKSVVLAYISVFNRKKIKNLRIKIFKRILLSIYGVISICFHQIFWLISLISICSVFKLEQDMLIISYCLVGGIILFDFIKTIQHYKYVIKNHSDRILLTM